MPVEQPSLGSVGTDACTFHLDWGWEGGWALVASRRLSGSSEWTKGRWEGLSAEEAYNLVCTAAAEALGLV